MNTAVMFSTGKDDWATPPEIFDPLHAEFRFAWDVAASKTNRKVPHYFGPDHQDPAYWDALDPIPEWGMCNWCNPPYSRGLQSRFIAKAARVAQGYGATTVMLLPARTDTKAFHEHIWDATTHKPRPWVREVRFLKGRIRFVGAPASAPFPSMVVVFG